MIRWVAVIFLALTIFPVLIPWLTKLGIGRVPGDFSIKLGGRAWCLPFGSTLVASAVVFLIAELGQYV